MQPFEYLRPHPADPIFELMAKFQADPRPNRVNLGIGMYHNEAGVLPILDSVRRAIDSLRGSEQASRYLPMAGYADYCHAAKGLLFGTDDVIHPGRIATIQTLGGTGALRIGAEVLKKHFTQAEVWISDPSWDNHLTIFSSAGFKVQRYPYLTDGARAVDFAGMLACFERLPPHSIVLLHACCHNPTGADLSRAQWLQLAELVSEKSLIPFFDFAYQGFGEGIEEDAYAIRLMAEMDISFVVANSFSKNFALYGERCGALSFYCANEHQANMALAQMEHAVRGNYSNPPLYGARIIACILRDAELNKLWRAEVDEMRERLQAMRKHLIDALSRNAEVADLNHLRDWCGMFVGSGLSPTEVDELRIHSGIYLAPNGRLCLAGLNKGNVGYVADAIIKSMLKRLSPPTKRM